MAKKPSEKQPDLNQRFYNTHFKEPHNVTIYYFLSGQY